jgi:hypothetical protein
MRIPKKSQIFWAKKNAWHANTKCLLLQNHRFCKHFSPASDSLLKETEFPEQQKRSFCMPQNSLNFRKCKHAKNFVFCGYKIEACKYKVFDASKIPDF